MTPNSSTTAHIVIAFCVLHHTGIDPAGAIVPAAGGATP